MNPISFILGAPIKAQRQPQRLRAEPEELVQFKAYYEEHIEPLTRKFENHRVASLKALRGRLYTSLGILLGLALLILVFSLSGYLDIPWVFFIVLCLPFGWWSYRPLKRYKRDVKQEVFPKIFRYFGPDFIFSTSHNMSLTQLKRSKLLPGYDNAKFDDYVQGTYKGVEIAINELCLTKQVKREKSTETETVFRGVMVQLSSHKRFKGHTVVVKNRGGLVNFLSSSFKRLNRVKLEDPRFEKQFDVFSSDQIEARYLLTLGFMERLQSLANLFSGKIQCAFYEDKLLIMLQSGDNRFELGSIFNGATFEYEFSQINREMKQLFAMIEVLKLDQNIGF
ncbi:DUF3137 domain-containing protein [Shewanella insulae]|uniref:DUF3137 domain-containing protein n=1 Tax=Shewanella insulae TaxID=2681496 RepID=A0A6L7HZ59_9GAMM|nr:DUF3137 domain-containing protein [Shewanella insulae]MCG9737070.1 DUF3137 domain-containing protein [Shewanella insulae]MXR69597.1 DUF3137 domain-containing protein [Shewanella insulae]